MHLVRGGMGHITVKELLPIVVACAVWGHRWPGEVILAHTDNASVVAILNSGRSKDPLAMYLICCLLLLSASHNYTVRAKHMAGKLNVAANALSRGHTDVFCEQVPTADKEPINPSSARAVRTNHDKQAGLDLNQVDKDVQEFSQKAWPASPTRHISAERSNLFSSVDSRVATHYQ